MNKKSNSRHCFGPLKVISKYLWLPTLVLTFTSWAGEQDFYKTFLKNTDDARIVAITSPLLVDTNNTTPKLTNPVINLSNSKASGQFGPVGLEMTMEEVVDSLGKPPRFWSKCGGGPRFCYNNVHVVFETATNSVHSVIYFAKDGFVFEEGLSASSNINDFIRVLGIPSARNDKEEELVYVTPFTTMRLQFVNGHLWNIHIEPGMEKPNRQPAT